jgi:hypothetical protein
MKHLLLLGMIVMFVPGMGMGAQEYELVGLGTRVQGMVDATVQSRYVWRGFDWFGNRAAWQLTAGAQLPDIGLGGVISGHQAIGSGYVDRERWDYSGYYRNAFAKGERHEFSFRLGYVYYNHPKLPSAQNDMQEVHAVLAMPRIFQIKGLVPSYVPVLMWPGQSDALINNAGYAEGWLHIFNLDYIVATPSMVPEMGEQVVKLHSEITYNGGVNPVDGVPIESGLSHVVLGASTDFQLGYGLVMPFGGYYQFSLEESVNPEDRFWLTLGIRYQY